jgi:hypothetical protein
MVIAEDLAAAGEGVVVEVVGSPVVVGWAEVVGGAVRPVEGFWVIVAEYAARAQEGVVGDVGGL